MQVKDAVFARKHKIDQLCIFVSGAVFVKMNTTVYKDTNTNTQIQTQERRNVYAQAASVVEVESGLYCDVVFFILGYTNTNTNTVKQKCVRKCGGGVRFVL